MKHNVLIHPYVTVGVRRMVKTIMTRKLVILYGTLSKTETTKVGCQDEKLNISQECIEETQDAQYDIKEQHKKSRFQIMSTFLGSDVSGILIDETQLVLISNGNNAIKLLTASNNVDFGGYSLTNLGALQADLDLNSHKLVNVADPTSNQDAATKIYVDTKISDLIGGASASLDTLNELAQALNDDASFATTVTTSLATKFNSADFNSTFATQYGLTDITSAAAQSGNYSANNHRFVDVADPVGAQDAATKQYVDDTVGAINTSVIVSSSGRNTVEVTDTDHKTVFTNDDVQTAVLDSTSLRPLVPIDMGSRKIVGLANATDKEEAMNLGQSLRHQWLQASLSSELNSGFTETYTVPFDNVTLPGSLTTPVTNSVSNSSGTLALSNGRYLVTLMLGCTYDNAVSQPVNMAFVGQATGVSPLLNIVTNRAHAFGVQIFTTASAILNVTAGENFTLRLTNTTYLTSIDRNTKVLVQKLY